MGHLLSAHLTLAEAAQQRMEDSFSRWHSQVAASLMLTVSWILSHGPVSWLLSHDPGKTLSQGLSQNQWVSRTSTLKKKVCQDFYDPISDSTVSFLP